MEEVTVLTGERIRNDLAKFPPLAAEEFTVSWQTMSAWLNDPQIVRWAEIGLGIANQTVRSWESAAQFYTVSPNIVGLMPFSYFEKWAQAGASLCEDSPTLASAYFIAGPATLKTLRARHIEEWANMGRRLYKGTWKSGTLASKFFEASPRLVQNLKIEDLERFVAFLEYVSHRSYDVAVDALGISQKIFPLMGENSETFISFAYSLAENNWRQVKALFEATARALPRIAASERVRFITLSDSLRESGHVNVPGAMIDISQALDELDTDHHERLLELAEGMIRFSPEAMPEFIKISPRVLKRVTMNQLEKWYDEGVTVLKRNSDGGMAFFRLESSRAQESLEALSASVEFDRVQGLMEMYCRALAGAEVEIAASAELAEKRIGWISPDSASTEGGTVYVPGVIDRYPTKDENFALLKVISTHQVARLEFGSFHFIFEKPATRFRDLRAELESRIHGGSSAEDEGAGAPVTCLRSGC